MSRDFSRKSKGLPFTADGDEFMTTPGAAAMLVGDVVARIQSAGGLDAKMEAIEEFFNVVLVDASFELMKDRLRSKTNPIDLGQAMDIVSYLVEEIGGRPTTPSGSSSDGSATEETGTSLMVGAASEVSIPTNSPSTDSVTFSTATS